MTEFEAQLDLYNMQVNQLRAEREEMSYVGPPQAQNQPTATSEMEAMNLGAQEQAH